MKRKYNYPGQALYQESYPNAECCGVGGGVC
nr:MAG TPA: Heterodisulfide reductase, subunit A [Caudoviricetes sp.]